GINKKELAELAGMPYATVNSWGSRNPYPPYLKFMLENYIKAKNYENIKNQVFLIEGIKGS
ncbi:XRE family transcriptional regulator, partial [Campylobacter sp. RM16191]